MNQSPVNGGIAAVPKKKVYISGPIAHYDLQERKNTFAQYADMLEQLGYTPVNPFDNPLHRAGRADADWREHMREDIRMLLDCDCILMLPDWWRSKGCKLELDVASSCGIMVATSIYLL